MSKCPRPDPFTDMLPNHISGTVAGCTPGVIEMTQDCQSRRSGVGSGHGR